MVLFKGAATALVTPFRNGKVDYESLGRLIDWQIESGIDGLVICGTTGEASTLSDEEHLEVVRFAVKRTEEACGKSARRIPVLAGAGSNDTAHALKLAKALEQEGIDGLLVVTPYYNKCTDAGLLRHYTHLADRLEKPIILYSVPGRTGVNIGPAVVKELCGHPNIAGIKEASGNIAQAVEIARYCSEDFALYSGNDDSIVPLLSVGGSGVISVLSNVMPQAASRMVHAYLSGDTEAAKGLQLELKPLIDALFCEVNPIPVKQALAFLGRMEAEYRLPLCPASFSSCKRIREALMGAGLL
ncbi:MAG: 4-hydroxy-tetrahydrodipicolinate synthase [Clostridiales bacterium]|nr:4-hydroxy-tetrahydrodipicolinate synthase [Clostridiales bacterium]MBQ3107765.1 4-hydroxy-tetrahydrodipicolinate synthase [Bacillota bacterium]